MNRCSTLRCFDQGEIHL